MAEYIEKEPLITMFNNLANEFINGDKQQRGIAYSNAADMVALTEAADVQPVNKWISVDEALPKVGQRVLVYYPDWIENEELQVAHLEETYGAGIQFVTYDDVRLPTVTYWQPLPEPPETMKG